MILLGFPVNVRHFLTKRDGLILISFGESPLSLEGLLDSSSGPKRIFNRIYHAVVFSVILPVHINASSAVCVMLQCFPVLIISKLKPVSCFMLILALGMKSILDLKGLMG
jgi:hypothetical protein